MSLTYAVPTRQPAPPRRRRMLGPALVIGGLSAATLALHLRDPHSSGSWGFCPSALLGFACPGCGGLRAVNDLTNLHLADAASSNLLFVLALPFLVWALVRWTSDEWRGVTRIYSAAYNKWLPIVVITSLVVFTVLRNLPFGAWLAPGA